MRCFVEEGSILTPAIQAISNETVLADTVPTHTVGITITVQTFLCEYNNNKILKHSG